MTIFSDLIHPYGVPHQDCSQCGKCTSGCPAARILELRPRRIVLMAQRGMIDQLLDSKAIWQCTQCHQCMERCPRSVTPFDLIMHLQNAAIKTGRPYPASIDQLYAAIRRLGYVQEPQEVFDKDFETYRREDLGLPPIIGPHDMAAFRRSVEETARW